jgi:hypothetical protein
MRLDRQARWSTTAPNHWRAAVPNFKAQMTLLIVALTSKLQHRSVALSKTARSTQLRRLSRGTGLDSKALLWSLQMSTGSFSTGVCGWRCALDEAARKRNKKDTADNFLVTVVKNLLNT